MPHKIRLRLGKGTEHTTHLTAYRLHNLPSRSPRIGEEGFINTSSMSGVDMLQELTDHATAVQRMKVTRLYHVAYPIQHIVCF